MATKGFLGLFRKDSSSLAQKDDVRMLRLRVATVQSLEMLDLAALVCVQPKMLGSYQCSSIQPDHLSVGVAGNDRKHKDAM